MKNMTKLKFGENRDKLWAKLVCSEIRFQNISGKVKKKKGPNLELPKLLISGFA